MRRASRQYAWTLGVIAALIAMAAFVAVWMLGNQGVRAPWAEGTFLLKAELSSAQAVTPGQGQSVQVSGVRVGIIGGAELRDGRAIVKLELDPEFKDLVHTDATALLRPKTGLKDMLVELDPGSDAAPLAKEGWTIPVANTRPDVNVDEILKMLDADSRAYLQLLVGNGARGLGGNGTTLREIFRRFEPLHRDLARVNGRLAGRRSELRRIVHSLRELSDELAGRDDELAALVSASARVFRAFASEDRAVSASLSRMPEALRETRVALERVGALARELKPASEELAPVLARLKPASKALEPLAREATPVVRDDLRPFVREARPVTRALRGPAADLAKTAEPARRVGVVLNHLLNMLAYNPDGREGMDDPNREEGFLFWAGWGNHIVGTLHATGDAHGPVRGLALAGGCSGLAGYADVVGQGDPLLGTVIGGLQGVFTDQRICGNQALQPRAFRERLAGGKLERGWRSRR